MKRRDFLKTMLASGVAPAYIGSSVLMPVKEIISIHSPLTTTQMLERERIVYLMNPHTQYYSRWVAFDYE